MEKIKDRRSLDRTAVASVSAKLRDKRWYDIISDYLSLGSSAQGNRNIVVKDISKSGACITCEHRHECGDPVHLVISIPGENNIWIKGRVLWVETENNHRQYCIGIQFHAYGSGRNLNSMSTLEQLRNVHHLKFENVELADSPES